MAILPASLARVSNQLRSNTALNQLQRTQAELMRVQNQLTTGRQLNAPSDNPGDAAIAQQVRKTLEKRDAYASNLKQASNNLASVDTTLNDVSDLLQQAQDLASANVGDGVTQDERNNAAVIVRSVYQQLITLGNKSIDGSYLFAGDKLDHPPFEEFAGGVKFVGSDKTLLNDVDEATATDFQVNGADVFGALSTRVDGVTTLAPTVSTTTRLDDLKGSANSGVQKGMLVIGNGTDIVNLDLSGADSVGDVVNAINNAGLGSVTAAINASGNGLEISGGAGETLSITDVGGGTLAADLGVRTTAPMAAGAPVVGTSVNARVTKLTPLSALNAGAGIDLSGLVITNGAASATIDLTGAVTVEDMINAVNSSNTGVQMSINDDGTGLRLQNPTQGAEMRIAENGGTTASDLGLRSFNATSKLIELNDGKGVRVVDGADFKLTDSNGVGFDVDLTTAMTSVQDVIDAINTAATTAGAGVTASFATTGNGITITDTSGGAGTLKLDAQNYSQAAQDLGLTEPAAGNVIAGKDVSPVIAQGIFANVAKLRDAMAAGDQKAMTAAAEALKSDYDRVVRTRGEVGARGQAVEARQNRLDDETLNTKKLLSELEDTDFTEAISKFSLLQTSLEASLKSTSTMLNLSLMDFLS